MAFTRFTADKYIMDDYVHLMKKIVAGRQGQATAEESAFHE